MFRIRTALAALLLLLPVLTHSQGAKYSDYTIDSNGHAVGGIQIRVCATSSPSTPPPTAPCSPLATLYADQTLVTTAPNPLTSDAVGNFSFYAPTGFYILQFYQSGAQVFAQTVQVGTTNTNTIFNATVGFQVNGSFGSNGQCLTSTGTGSLWSSCAAGGVGTVTNVSSTSSLLSIANPTTTPAITPVVLGTGTKLATTSATAPASAKCAEFDTNGNLTVAGSNAACGAGGGGITTINPGALTGPTVTFATGTSGTDFAVSGATNTVTFNLPTASATNRGALSSADWSTFNGKQATVSVTSPITLTGASIGMVNQGTTTTVLHGNAAGNPAFAAVTSADTTGTFTATAHNLLSAAHGDTTAGSVAVGDVITGQTGPKWARLAANATATKMYLQSVSSATPSWAQIAYTEVSGTPTLRYQTVQDEGSNLAQEPLINFTGTGVTCSDNAGVGTNCNITSGGGTSTAGATLFSTTTLAGPSNTVTETSLLSGTGISGSKTFAANTFQNGTVLQVEAAGFYSTPAVTVDNLTIRVKCGSTVLASRVISGLVVAATNQAARLYLYMHAIGSGASGSLLINTIAEFTGTTLTASEASMVNTAAVAFDFTTSCAFDVTAQWAGAQAGESISAVGAAWIPGAPVSSVNGSIGAVSVGTVTSVATTAPITGGTINTTGTIACATCATITNGGALTATSPITLSAAGVIACATCGVTGTGLQQFASTTSLQLLGVMSDETGTGALAFATSPTLVTPILGVATATSINKVALTAPATSSTLTIADGKTLTASNTLTLTGTDGSSVVFGTGGTVAYTANNLSVFASTTSLQLAGVISNETGSGLLVFGTSPALTTPSVTTINDANANPFIASTATASAVDSIIITNAATANPATVSISATGTDANINLNLVSKGTGTVQCNGASCGAGGGVTSVSGTTNQIASTGGTTPVLSITNPFTFPGKATFVASATGASSFNIPSGTAPTTPAAGDCWLASNVLNCVAQIGVSTGYLYYDTGGVNARTDDTTGTITPYTVHHPVAAPTIISLENTDSCAGSPPICTETWVPNQQVLRVNADFTTAANTNFQTPTGMTITLPASTALNMAYDCHWSYSQVVAAADSFGIQSATIAPTSIMGTATMGTSATAGTSGTLLALTTTTATAIVSATPTAATNLILDMHGMVENPSNVSTNVINFMVKQGTAADVIVVKRGSWCKVF